MYTNIKDYFAFRRRVRILTLNHYEDLDLEILPCTPVGGFHKRRLVALLQLARQLSEYHIISCFNPTLFVNAYVPNALAYYLADGEVNPFIIPRQQRAERHVTTVSRAPASKLKAKT